jgi:hypothetical protein
VRVSGHPWSADEASLDPDIGGSYVEVSDRNYAVFESDRRESDNVVEIRPSEFREAGDVISFKIAHLLSRQNYAGGDDEEDEEMEDGDDETMDDDEFEDQYVPVS